MDFLLDLLKNPAVQGGLVLIALRLVPNDYLAKLFFGFGRVLSAGGNKYLGRLWEEVVENTVGVCLRNLLDGMASDDPVEVKK